MKITESKLKQIVKEEVEKMNKIIDFWVPATKSGNTFLDTKGWEKAAEGYKPGKTKKGKGTFVPAGDDL